MSAVEITMPYVYMVKNKKTGHWYIGKQGNIRKVIGHNYFTTSVSKHPVAQLFQKSFARDSEELNDWDIKILFQGDDYEEAEEILIELMGLYHPENNPLSLNFGNAGMGFSRHGTVTVYDYTLGSTVSIPQEEYYLRKQNGGVISAMEHPETMAKYQETCMENLGVTHPLLSVEVQAKSKKTCLMNFGVPHSMQSPEVQAKSKETCLEKYGVDNPFKSLDVQEKIKETNMKNFGVSNASQSPEVQAKRKETCLENYGVDNPFKSLEIQAKVKETNMNNLGVPYAMQSLEVQAKSRTSNIEHFGVPYAIQSPEVQAKRKETCLEKYGVEHSLQSKEVRDKGVQTLIEKYGVINTGQLRRISVVAYIENGDYIQAIGVFESYTQAGEKLSLDITHISNCARKVRGVKSTGIYNKETNSIVPHNEFKLLGIGNKNKLPSEAHPNLYRVKWMRLEDFQQTHPTVPLPSMEPPANDSQYIAPELSAHL